MTQKKKAKSPKKQSAGGSKRDSLTKASKKGNIELTEKELGRVSGGIIRKDKEKV